ncbi:hypothetical protein N0V88_008110 [Collariella sp. IMI 366227]|nr:hypothetical protein N0V88_008110 [Collariella sp. IMI 366227]
MQNTEGAPTAPQDEQEPVSLKLAESPIGAAHTIKGALEQHKLSSWGFVLFRCTYGSQEKWDKFVARVQKYARDEFEEAGLMDVYARMRWTVFEDEAALDGADILETTNRFVKWVDRGPGGQELVGSVFGTTMNTNATARHSFFFHVDEESLENVLDDTKVVKAWWMPGGPSSIYEASKPARGYPTTPVTGGEGTWAPYARQTHGPAGQNPKWQENEHRPAWLGLPVSLPEMQTVPGAEEAGAVEDEVRVDVTEPELIAEVIVIAGAVPLRTRTQIARSSSPTTLAKRPASQSAPSQGFQACRVAIVTRNSSEISSQVKSPLWKPLIWV